MSSPVIIVYRDSVTILEEDGTIQTHGTSRPVSVLLERLKATGSPAARAADDPIVRRIVELFDGRIEAIEPYRYRP